MLKLFSLKKVGSLKALLFYWVIGSGVCLVVFYSTLLEYQFRYGVELSIRVNLEWYAERFEADYVLDSNTPLPKELGMRAYRSLDELPQSLKDLAEHRTFVDRELEIFLGHEYDDEWQDSAFNDAQICEVRTCDLIFIYAYQLKNGEWLYFAQGIAGSEQLHDEKDFAEFILIVISLLVIASTGWLASKLVKKITAPVQQLDSWAKQLKDQSDIKRPDFKYKELNQVAIQLEQAFLSIRASVEKEYQFLQQVSHELRTPLATASGNIDILKLLEQKVDRTPQEQNAIDRLNHAIYDMRQLTETILWLNRDKESLPEQDLVYLREVVKAVIDENHYLIASKPVAVEVVGQSDSFDCYGVLCTILISNLIRNAFQYTYEGKVRVKISQNCLEISNENIQSCEYVSTETYGFGLGLTLVEQIAERMGWYYECHQLANGWSTVVRF